MSYEKEVAAFLAAGGEVTKCPTKKAKGSAPRTVMVRSKKCMSYGSDVSTGFRMTQYDGGLNVAGKYGGVKMVMS